MDHFAFYKSEIGTVKIGYDQECVFFLKIADKEDTANEPSTLSDEAFRQFAEYLDGKRRKFTFPYKPRGTYFQNKVWNALKDIPYGTTKTYKEIAAIIGNSGASRAVGAANRANPIWIVVPCHRIIRSDGSLSGYAGGTAMKRKLIELEKKNGTV